MCVLFTVSFYVLSSVGGAQATSVVGEPALCLRPRRITCTATTRTEGRVSHSNVTSQRQRVRFAAKKRFLLSGAPGSKSCQEQDDGAKQQ